MQQLLCIGSQGQGLFILFHVPKGHHRELKGRCSVLPNFGGDHHSWVGPGATSLTALSCPMPPHVEGPSRAHDHEGALWLYAAAPRAPASDARGGPFALNP